MCGAGVGCRWCSGRQGIGLALHAAGSVHHCHGGCARVPGLARRGDRGARRGEKPNLCKTTHGSALCWLARCGWKAASALGFASYLAARRHPGGPRSASPIYGRDETGAALGGPWLARVPINKRRQTEAKKRAVSGSSGFCGNARKGPAPLEARPPPSDGSAARDAPGFSKPLRDPKSNLAKNRRRRRFLPLRRSSGAGRRGSPSPPADVPGASDSLRGGRINSRRRAAIKKLWQRRRWVN